MKLNIPTLLTLMRVAIIPVCVICYYLPFSWAHPLAAIFLFFGGVLDVIDGYLARKLNQTTRFGAFLDPVADKLAISTGMIVVAAEYSLVLLTLCAVIIIAREITISALREWMAEIGKRSSVKVAAVGKLKTVLQALALLILVWVNPTSPGWLFTLGLALLVLATILTVWSMIVYLKLAWCDLTLE